MNLRTLRRSVARLLVGMLVYAQLAVAAYACVGAATGLAGAGTAEGNFVAGHGGAAQTMQLDPDQPALCVAHCRNAQQTAGVEPPTIPPTVLVAGYFTLEPVVSRAATHGGPVAKAASLPPIADPPQRILHCCLRI
jgi:hypothetical protein